MATRTAGINRSEEMTSSATYIIYVTKQATGLLIITSISGGSPGRSAISVLHWTLFGPKLKLLKQSYALKHKTKTSNGMRQEVKPAANALAAGSGDYCSLLWPILWNE